MRRRELLELARGRERALDLSCETLYMSYVSSRLHGTSERFLSSVAQTLRGARTVRLHGASWLESGELRDALTPLLDELRARGGVVEYV